MADACRLNAADWLAVLDRSPHLPTVTRDGERCFIRLTTPAGDVAVILDEDIPPRASATDDDVAESVSLDAVLRKNHLPTLGGFTWGA